MRRSGRSFLNAAAATAVTAAMGSDLLLAIMWLAIMVLMPRRCDIPIRDIVVLDKRFAKYKIGNTPITSGCTHRLPSWAEGPKPGQRGRQLSRLERHSQRPSRSALGLDLEDGHVSVIRNPAGNSNGNTFDYEGRQISCEHGTRKVVRDEYNGKTTTSSPAEFQGKPLNAPNDVIVHPRPRECIWFTPTPAMGQQSDGLRRT